MGVGYYMVVVGSYGGRVLYGGSKELWGEVLYGGSRELWG